MRQLVHQYVQFFKPNTSTKQELIVGIENFWNEKVTIDYCNCKIDHLNPSDDISIYQQSIGIKEVLRSNLIFSLKIFNFF